MSALAQHFTADQTASARLSSLIASHRATLDLAEAYTASITFAPVAACKRHWIATYRNRIAGYERRAAQCPTDAGASHALGMLGHNGCGPAIEDLLRSCRFQASMERAA